MLPIMVWRISADFRDDWANQAWVDFTGPPLFRQVGFQWLELVHPEDQERVSEDLDIAFAAKEPAALGFRLKRSDGVYCPVIDIGLPVFQERRFIGYLGVCAPSALPR